MKHFFAAAFIGACVFQAAAAQGIQWQLLGGMNISINTDERNSDPSPIAGTMGVEALVPIVWETSNSGLFAAPNAVLFYTRYLWANDRALPAAIENRTAIVPALYLDIPLVYKIPVSNATLRVGAGIGMLIRWGICESGVPPEDYGDVDSINSYLWGSGRFLYPSIQIGGSYRTPRGFEPGCIVKCGLPIANLWAQPSVPFVDSMIISVLFSIKIK